MPRVNHEILKWARKGAGLSLDEACKKLAIRPARGMSAKERLEDLERGEANPTRALLEKMAKQYRRPLLTFYLPMPPKTVSRGKDLRSLPEDRNKLDEALLDALIRDVRARQSMIKALMEDEDEAVTLPFVGVGTVQEGVDRIATRLGNAVAFDLAAFRDAADADQAFSKLRSLAESAGVFVLLMGDLGSHHTGLSVETFRGISLSDPVAPVVVINDRDARSAWSFTLLHELTHVYLGQTTISGSWSGLRVEQICNDVASQMLLPDREIGSFGISPGSPLPVTQARIEGFAREMNLSSTMVSYRLFRHGSISELEWQQLRRRFRELWNQGVRSRRARNREAAGGPDYYVVRRHRIGSYLVGFVARMLHNGAVTTSRAGRILGIKPTNVYSLIERAS